MNIADLTGRNGLFADSFDGVTAEQVPGVMRDLSMPETTARIISERSAEDAMAILGVPADVYEAICAYVKAGA
jgi:hypothetical protein